MPVFVDRRSSPSLSPWRQRMRCAAVGAINRTIAIAAQIRAVVEPLEALLEREDEQEREQNLRPRHREAVLLDELAPLLVEVVFPPAHGLYVPPSGPG